ncbi:coiled-coil domain-containing protein 149 isoform X2 [Aricia agestis]|uniref:coiled-coil domain-containing protein 149 isoform X2 n=1 Tax=Aricia agestis TaxID=91739 RepID=UPI001C20BF9B|nr:coiled-coil domain-containing protein 149 isoform X2 [Aricia agestis]
MFAKSNKVQFQDQQLDDYVLENSVLKSKLQSKIDALSIMSKELDKCSMERDRYRLLVEQIQSKKVVFKEPNNFNRFTPTNTISGSEILAKTKDHNNALKIEVESLRSKLEEAYGDISALRKQLQNYNLVDGYSTGKIFCPESPCNSKEFEKLVQDLEGIQKKYRQIQSDYRATLDEKEELVSDRDYYKNKVQRLNQQINYILTNRMKKQENTSDSNGSVDSPKPVVDIDALVAENKYLNERLTQLQVEKEIFKRNLTKYKTLLENRGKNQPTNLKKGVGDVMTQKQVREYLDINSKTGLKRSSAAELKSLCLGLFEALNDKSIALQHQRKTNQILASRITELEKTLESWSNGQKCIPIFPSQMLIEDVLNDSSSTKSDEQDRNYKEHPIKENTVNSDDENEVSKDTEYCYDSKYTENGSDRPYLSSKTILPFELEELVQEALAELKAEH